MSQPPAGPVSSAPQFGSAHGVAPELAPSSTGGSLRRPALAVVVLAVLVILVKGLHQVLMIVEGATTAMQYVVQAFYLVTNPLSFLLAAAVIWLLVSARRPDGRVGLRPLLAFALLVLLELLGPAWTVMFAVLELVNGFSDVPSSMIAVSPILWFLLDVALTLPIGIIGLLLLVRPAVERRGVRIPPRPGVLALVLMALALVTLVLVPITAFMSSNFAYSSSAGTLLSGGVSTLAALTQALQVPVAGLLIAVTTGRLRLLAWAALGMYWLSWFGATLVIRIMVFQLIASPEFDSVELWGVFRGIVEGLGALGVAVIVAILLVLLLRGRRSSATPGADPKARALAPRPIH